MKTAAALLAVATLATAAPAPTATVDIVTHESLYNKAVAATLPAAVAEVKDINFPAIKTKTVTVAPTKFSGFNIAGVNVKFSAPAAVAVEVESLYVALPSTKFSITANLDAKQSGLFGAQSTGGITCSGTLSFNQTATSTFSVDVVRNATSGKLAAAGSNAQIKWADLGVDVDLAPGLCKDMAGIVGNLDAFIKKEIEKKLAPALAKLPAKAIDTIGAKLPGTLNSPPTVSGTGLFNAINLIGDAQGTPAAYWTTFPGRDVEFGISSSSANVINEALFTAGLLAHTVDVPADKFNTTAFKKFLPAKYAECPDCPVAIEVKPSEAPTMEFNGGATLAVENMLVGIDALPANNGPAMPLIQLLVNATGSLSNFTASGAEGNTIKFEVEVPTLKFAAFNNTLPAMDVMLLNDAVQMALPAILKKFNAGFAGATIPAFKGNAIENVEFAFQGNTAFLGADVKFGQLPVPTAALKQMV